jgi:hypothetical protein
MKSTDPDEHTVLQITNLLEDVKKNAFRDGYTQGRLEMADELRAACEAVLHEPPDAKSKSARPVATVPKIESIEDAVHEVLTDLAGEFIAGVEPQAIAEYFRSSPVPLDVKQVRAALRQLVTAGQAHRVADGRYLPGPASAVGTEETAQAETVS